MDFLTQIQSIPEEELESFVKTRIAELEAISREKSPQVDTIGYLVENQQKQHEYSREGAYYKVKLGMRVYYKYFIRKDTKMTYGIMYGKNGMAGNDGNYYYMDDQDYLIDFCRYIQQKDIIDEYELLGYMRDFLKKYFGIFEVVNRDNMHSMLLDTDLNPYPLIQEHSIRDFKGKGNALCSEYAAMAQNLMQLFGLDSAILIGKFHVDGKEPGPHSFNIVSLEDEETGIRGHAVVDFINPVKVYDLSFAEAGAEPFIAPIPGYDDTFIDRFIRGEANLCFSDYAYYILGDNMIKLILSRSKSYEFNDVLVPNNSVNQPKTYTK